MNPFKICYFSGSLKNTRNRVILEGLKQKQVDLIEIKDQGKGWRKLIDLFKQYWKVRRSVDVVLIGFPGQAKIFWLKLFVNQPLILDAFISLYNTDIEDREHHAKFSFKAVWYFFLDYFSVRLADGVLLDTNGHINYFVKKFHISTKKFSRLFIGAEDNIFHPSKNIPAQEKDYFLVHFHGSFIPLQGIEFILEAAKILAPEKVKFNIIGKGQTFNKMKNLADSLGLTNVNFTGWLPSAEVAEYQAKADVCLGIFGNTTKATLVIPNKVYEAMAMNKAVITGESAAIKELFTDGKDILFCQMSNAQDLAEKILLLKNNKELRGKIASHGHQLFKNKLTPAVLGEQLIDILMMYKK